MSQIVTVQVGGCGARVGVAFWDQLLKNISQTSQNSGDSYYLYHKLVQQGKNKQKIPRTIFIDSDIRTSDLVYQSRINFDCQSIIVEGASCYNLYAQGKYLCSQQFKENYSQRIQKQVQKCDYLSGFILIRSVSGGAGSGIGDNLLDHLSSHFADKIIQQFKILPGYDKPNTKKQLTCLENYNTVLSIGCSYTSPTLIYFFQNSAVENILQQRKVKKTDLGMINKFYGSCLNEHINSYISPNSFNMNQRKRATNLVLYPRIKSLTCGLSNQKQKYYISSALQVQNRLITLPQQKDTRMFALNINVRDNLSTQFDINKTVKSWINGTNSAFVEWIPHNIFCSISRQDHKKGKTAWTIFNATQNIGWKRKLIEDYARGARRKAFFHHYISRGMDQMQFVQSQSTFNDIISQYTVYDYYQHDSENQQDERIEQ